MQRAAAAARGRGSIAAARLCAAPAPLLHAHLSTWALRPMPANAAARTSVAMRLGRPLSLSLRRSPSAIAAAPLCRRHYKTIGDRVKTAFDEDRKQHQSVDTTGVVDVKKWLNEWTLPQQSHPLDGRLRALLVVAAVATGLAILRRFAQPNDHELLVHAAVIAERDPDIMVAINRLGKEERKRQKEDKIGSAMRRLLGDVQGRLRVSDPLMLRLGLVFDSDLKFDPAFAPPQQQLLPDGSLPAREQVPNRIDLWAALPETNFGDGQLHVIGRKIPEAIDREKAKQDGRRADGKFDVSAVAALKQQQQLQQEQQQQQQRQQASAAAAASTGTGAPVLVNPLASWMHEPLSAKPLEWEVVTLELIFPEAQPFPMAFVLDPQLQAFVKKAGIDCPPSHRPPSIARATLQSLREMAAFIAPTSVFSGLVWVAAALPVAYKLFASRLLPAQRSWSRRLVDSLRDHPAVRETLGLQNSGLGLGFSRPKVIFGQESSDWGKRVRRDSKGQASVQSDHSRLVQTYSVRNKATDKCAKVHIEAQKVLMEALWGRVHYRTWKVTQASIQTPGGAKVKLQGIKVRPGL